ncbi:MAG: RICIN domain-containing protein [Oligoflexus sp.]|nr:RICIN domain-containing protein [Oligoflexus sp.]
MLSLGKPGGGGGGPVAGQTYQLVARFSNKCADVDASGTANGTNIQQYTCNGTNACFIIGEGPLIIYPVSLALGFLGVSERLNVHIMGIEGLRRENPDRAGAGVR